ncbi:MAG: BrnT family toxin [Deltaproteobacteria bacterium]|nr:MAG: BrnT family toxin [Deltaproteobacteria bacterium]
MLEFEWDASKELVNFKKHKTTFIEAISCFSDSHGVQLFDSKHSGKENRYYWIGKSDQGRILTTWFTRRGSKIRIIGCAEWRKMRKYYETTKNK